MTRHNRQFDFNYQVGDYGDYLNTLRINGTVTPTEVVYHIPHIFPYDVILTELGVYVTTHTGTSPVAHIGIYSMEEGNFGPLLIDTELTLSGVGYYYNTHAFRLALGAGYYFISFYSERINGTGIILRACDCYSKSLLSMVAVTSSLPTMYYQSPATGTPFLPNPPFSFTPMTSKPPVLIMRLAA